MRDVTDPEHDQTAPDACELCEAAPITEWFHDDDECWVAECESCSVAMVVWRHHDPDPPAEVRERLAEVLLDVSRRHYDFEPYVDDRLRTIPTHYHAHARPRDGGSGWGRRRREPVA